MPLCPGGEVEPKKSQTVQFSLDRALYGTEGGKRVCEAIAANPTIMILSLPHHNLGDDGVVELFNWLSSGMGRSYRLQISEIDLGDNHFGDHGLVAITKFMVKNRRLKTLNLSRNDFLWDEGVLVHFMDAINSSRLQDLVFSSIPNGDVFVPYILSRLTTPYLKSLGLSMTGLTEGSASVIAGFIVSLRCRLRRLSLSGNSLGQAGVNTVLCAMQHNYSLQTVDLFANGDDIDYAMKKAVEARNSVLFNNVSREARVLLRTSRVVLLRRNRRTDELHYQAASPVLSELPLELKQHILTYLAPHLSITQCLHIFDYALSLATLPLLAMPTTHSCLPDSSAVPFGLSAAPQSPGEGDVCMGTGNSLSCRHETLKGSWLLKVGCDVPDPRVASALVSTK